MVVSWWSDMVHQWLVGWWSLLPWWQAPHTEKYIAMQHIFKVFSIPSTLYGRLSFRLTNVLGVIGMGFAADAYE